jgi:sugar lactone lactonase YvrE
MKHSTLLSVLLLLFFISANGQIIITSAGTGGGGFSGDGGPATAALLYQPYGVTLDKEGNLYISDVGNRRIRKVSPAYGGIITTIAGNGTAGYSGDGFDATYAQINGTLDVAIDKKGNVFISDGANQRIRKVSTDGIIRTFAGTGVAGYNGDGIPATSANLNTPMGICVDDTGNLIIIERNSLRIRKVDTFGIISTIAGKGTTGFTSDGLKADTASFYFLGLVQIDKAGMIYFTDNGRVRKIGASGQLITVAGNGTPGNTGDGGPATAASIDVSAFCIDTSGNIYFADGGANVIRKIAIDGTISRYAGSGVGGYSGDGGSALAAKLRTCGGVATTPGGDVFIGDVGNNRVRMVTTHLTTVVSQSDVEQNLKINPNPAIGTLYVTLTEDIIAEHDANILTIDGRLLMQFCLKSNSPTQIVINWPPGTYILKTSSAGRIISKLFTIF